MSDKDQNNKDNGEAEENEGQMDKEEEQDPNALTEQDKKIYNEILSSINRIDKKVKNAKQKVNVNQQQKQTNKRAEVTQIATKLIESKEKSEIVNKEDLINDVNSSFQQMVVEVYTENKHLKKKLQSLVAIIKEQNRKITDHMDKETKLKQQNEKLRDELMKVKDQKLLQGRTGNQKTNNSGQKTNNRSKAQLHQNQSQDYDFWSVPQNQSSAKKRIDFVADSNLWVNDKDIDKSVFITDQATKKR